MILMREIDAADHPLRHAGGLAGGRRRCGSGSASRPRSGSKWMSEAPSATAWPRMLLTSLITGASSALAADVGDLGELSGSSSSASSSAIASATVLCRASRLADQRLDVVRGRDRDPAVEPGRHLDVVDGEHVGGVGHRQQQRLLVDEADRDRLVAARRLDRDQVGRGHVDLVDGEVDVVEPVALGDRRARAARRRSTPCSSSSCSGVRPAVRACSIACSDLLAAWRSPSSTSTSVTNPRECPRRTGGVSPAGRRPPARGPARSSRRLGDGPQVAGDARRESCEPACRLARVVGAPCGPS